MRYRLGVSNGNCFPLAGFVEARGSQWNFAADDLIKKLNNKQVTLAQIVTIDAFNSGPDDDVVDFFGIMCCSQSQKYLLQDDVGFRIFIKRPCWCITPAIDSGYITGYGYFGPGYNTGL